MGKRTATRARNYLLSLQWAIRPELLSQMLAIAERRSFDLNAIAEDAGEYRKDTWATTVRDGVAYVPVTGVLARYMSWFTAICGGTSYEMLAQDFASVLRDPKVKAIVLDIDSPGGEVNGASELTQLITRARGIKPIHAYISGDGCSAAYWLASGADSIHAANTAIIGSLGVVATFHDDRERQAREGVREIEIVSSQSPHKRPDPTSDDGRTQIQRLLDALADQFIGAVATNRGVSVATVLEQYGQGDVFVGEAARARGLVDSITTKEQLHVQLTTAPAQASGRTTGRTTAARPKEQQMAKQKKKATRPGARVLALAEGDEVRASVTRSVTVSEGDTGTIGALLEGVNVVRFDGPNGEYSYLLDTEVEGAAATDDADGDDTVDGEGDPPEDEELDGAEDEDDEEEEASAFRRQARTRVRTVASLRAHFPALVNAVQAQERKRVAAILGLTPAGQEALALECINDGSTVDAAGRRFFEATREGSAAARHAAFTGADKSFTPPATRTKVQDSNTDEAAQTAARIVAAGRAARGENN